MNEYQSLLYRAKVGIIKNVFPLSSRDQVFEENRNKTNSNSVS